MPFWLSLTNTCPFDVETSPGWKVPTWGEMRVIDPPVLVECEQRAALAGVDAAHAGRAIGRDPQPLAAGIPRDRERMQAGGQHGQGPAGLAAGKDRAIEDARDARSYGHRWRRPRPGDGAGRLSAPSSAAGTPRPRQPAAPGSPQRARQQLCAAANGAHRCRRDIRGARHPVGAAIIGDEAARLAHQQHAGGDVPELEIVLPEAVEAARPRPRRDRARPSRSGGCRRPRARPRRRSCSIAATSPWPQCGMPVAISASARSRRAETRSRRSLSQAPRPFSAQKLSSVSG